MNTENEMFPTQEQKDAALLACLHGGQKQERLRIGFLITVYDAEPEKVVLSAVDEWEQLFAISEEQKAIVVAVSDQVLDKYMFKPLNNIWLNMMSREVDKFMRTHYPNQYTGCVRPRRAQLVAANEYRYRYLSGN